MPKRRAFHEFVKQLLSPIMLPIRSGPLKGKRWIATSGSAFIAGRYEPEKTAALADTVRAGDIVYDVGAHVGYFTVLMSQTVGADGRIYAFEPRPLNQRFLARHLRVNRCDNVEVFHLSVGDRDGPARLETRTGTGTGHVAEDGDLEVDMVSIDAMVGNGHLPPPTFIKIDVEGGELRVLEGARHVLETHRPRMVLATHSDELDNLCRALLMPLGYTMTDIGQLKGDTEYLVLPH